MDAFDPTEPYSRVYFLNERAPHLWTFNEHDFLIPSVCVWRDPAASERRIFVALSEDGHVVFLGPEQTQELIQDAGLHHELSMGYGYVNDVQQIGAHLYACGFSGQVYRRDGPGNWVHMDDGVLQSPEMDGGEYFAQAINGANERAIYLAGSENLPGHPPRADFWNGERWTRLTLPATAGRLTNIYIESEERIWMCGDRGTLLQGNARDGFMTMNPLGATELFFSVTKFRELIYLGSNVGLFQFDPSRTARVFRKVRTGLRPELFDANVVEAVDDVLWSLGPKDIARLDGAKWERFNHPDNPPIGA
jgi:hypothetical protein